MSTVTESGGATFSAALSTWKGINLLDLQKTLDKQGIEIVENQKENMVGRKRLAEQTRDFKKVSEEDKANAFRSLLKAYQTEIDHLTRRSKTAESAFLNVYKLLAEAPDPYPLLDAAVDQTARASEARLLESEVARQREETTALKQQLAEAQAVEKERKKLAEKVEKYDAKMEDMIQERVTQKEAELNAMYDERLRNYEDRERDLNRQVDLAKSQLRDLRSSHETTHAKLLDHSQRETQDTVARLAEMDLTTAELERANSRVAEMERRNEKLRVEIEAVRSGAESAEKVRALGAQISDLQAEASRLLRNLDIQKEDSARTQTEHSRRLSEQENKLRKAMAENEALRSKLDQFADYDEIKRELDIMKYVEFSSMSFDEDDPDDSMSIASGVQMPDPNADKNKNRGKPLENLLMSKNRKLQDQLTGLRVSHEELTASASSLSAELDSARSRLEEQRVLNDRLENDLLRINGSDAQVPEAITANAKQDSLASLSIGKREGTPTPTPASSSAETSILPIITSQRDRFRTRNAELEEELRKQFATITELRTEIKGLQADNLQLYEKVRYLQSYRDNTSTPAPPRLGASKRDEELGKYRSLYEESMNPFEAFRGKEVNRAVANLSPPEKVLLYLATFVLGRRAARSFFIVYLVLLHIFVLFTLWEATLSSDTIRHTDPIVPRPP